MAATSTRGREGEALGGRYELRRPIGSGGMAAVWQAEDVRLGREVAVKILYEGLADDAAFVARFQREARIAGGLTHPNLVSVFDYDAGRPGPYLVMEYVPGLNLAQRLEQGDAPPPERLAADLLAGLGAIHREGVVHRDVKPQNVLIAPDGRAILSDFGIARPEDATSITQTGQMPGTARYMAPELMEGQPASPASDLYSLGVVLQECLDARPAAGDVARLAERLADPEPRRRPASAAAALAELRAGLSPAVATDPTLELRRRGTPDAAARGSLLGLDRARLAALGGIVLAGVAVLVIAVSGGGGGSGGESARLGLKSKPAGGSESAKADGGGEAPKPGGGEAKPQPKVNPARGAALNDQGYALLQSGDAEQAIPILQRAVASYPSGSGDLAYGYALFNLAHALREAGRPEEAIPLLRERLEIPDQTETVQQELDAAIAEAGR